MKLSYITLNGCKYLKSVLILSLQILNEAKITYINLGIFRKILADKLFSYSKRKNSDDFVDAHLASRFFLCFTVQNLQCINKTVTLVSRTIVCHKICIKK